MDDTQSLELQLKTTGEETLKVLKEVASEITGIDGSLKDISKTIKNVSSVSSQINGIDTSAKKASISVDNLNKSFGKLISFAAIKRIGIKAFEFVDSASDRAEELNLFNVIFKNITVNGEKTFSELGQDAMRFQNQLNEAFGTNMTETLRYQGLFQAMATNQGVEEKYASLMSENMLKLTYDLASLYNRNEKTVAEALRGGVYAGQTKPLRGFGIDVTQTTMKPLLAELGIEKSVNELSQGEKQILRYIATLRQAQSAMGDFADTIESPANQLKIFKQQLAEVKVAIGNLFMGLYANILPYANAILMVIKEIAKALADLFGIDTKDYNSGLASTEEIYDGISTSAGNAAKSAKELKRQLLKFDEVNNLTTPSSSGSGSGSGGINGGIDQRLLDALKGYDNLMGQVKMKATAIRDRIMEWLGFTKEVNLLTDETSFKFDHITGGTVLGALAVGGTIYTGVKKIYDMVMAIFGKKAVEETGSAVLSTAAGGAAKGAGTAAGGAAKGAGTAAGGKGLASIASAVGYTDLVAAGGALAFIATEMYDVNERAKELNTFEYKKTGLAEGIEDFNTLFGLMSLNPIGAVFNFNTINDMLATMQDGMSNVITQGAIFDETISEISQEKLTDLINEFITLDNIVGEMKFTGKIISKDDVTIMKNLLKMIKQTIVKELDADKNAELGNLKVLEKALGAKDYKNIVDSIKGFYEEQKLAVEEGEKQINDIIAAAAERGGALRQDELDKIDEIRSTMMDNGIKIMTESEEEYIKITTRLNHNMEALTLERASAIIKSAKETKEKAIQEAEEQYDNVILQAEKLRQAGIINEDEYNKMIDAAELAKQETIQKSDEQYSSILSTVKEKLGESASYVDTETGEIKTKMEEWNENLNTGITTGFEGFKTGLSTLLSDIGRTLLGWTGISTFKTNTETEMGSLKTSIESWKPKIPRISWSSNGKQTTGTLKSILEALGLPTTLPKLSVTWVSQYANGGFPEDGLFFANHNELVGKFSNGKTAVANNEQIIQGIQSGVYTGVLSAMSQTNAGSSKVDVDVYVHSNEEVVVDKINQKTKQTGVCPINIPA
jgi:hypothetical protein